MIWDYTVCFCLSVLIIKGNLVINLVIQNSYCRYESHGSIYFDTTAFSAAPNHYYAKIVPEAFGDMAALKEGEGKRDKP